MKDHDATEIAFKNDYGKATNEINEIFDEINNLIERYLNDASYTIGDMALDVAELKKKYSEKK